MSKQDRQGVRTAADLERKYRFGKSFAEVLGIAEEARELAEDAEGKLDGNMTAEEIYNFLTNNGENQGLFRYEDGALYINAEYIKAVEALFEKKITVKGTLTNTAEVYVPPGEEEMRTIQEHALGLGLITSQNTPLYDVNGDGIVDIIDLAAFNKMRRGRMQMSEWSGAKKSTVTVTIDVSNPDKCIRIEGENMWGRQFSQYIGISGTNIIDTQMADYVVEQGLDALGWTFRKWNSGKWEGWYSYDLAANPIDLTKQLDGMYYGTSPIIPLPSDVETIDFAQADGAPNNHICFTRIFTASKNSVTFLIACNTSFRANNGNTFVYAVGTWA